MNSDILVHKNICIHVCEKKKAFVKGFQLVFMYTYIPEYIYTNI